MSVAGLNTVAITAAQTGVTNLTTSMTALTAQITSYNATLTTILNSASTLALVPDVASQAFALAGFKSQLDAIKAELVKFQGSTTIPT